MKCVDKDEQVEKKRIISEAGLHETLDTFVLFSRLPTG